MPNRSWQISPKELQRMRLRQQKHHLKVVYKVWSLKCPSVTSYHEPHFPYIELEQICWLLDLSSSCRRKKKKEWRRKIPEVKETNLEEATFATDRRLKQIRQEPNKDASLQTPMTLIGNRSMITFTNIRPSNPHEYRFCTRSSFSSCITCSSCSSCSPVTLVVFVVLVVL